MLFRIMELPRAVTKMWMCLVAWLQTAAAGHCTEYPLRGLPGSGWHPQMQAMCSVRTSANLRISARAFLAHWAPLQVQINCTTRFVSNFWPVVPVMFTCMFCLQCLVCCIHKLLCMQLLLLLIAVLRVVSHAFTSAAAIARAVSAAAAAAAVPAQL
jgi:hypothetical protein